MLYRGPERRLIDRRSGAHGPIYDLLDWCVMQDPSVHLDGSHKLYSVLKPDKFYWIKSDQGFPWDIELLKQDANGVWMIYHWITELQIAGHWSSSPRDYKKTFHNTSIPLMYRYAYDGDYVESSDDLIGVYRNCVLDTGITPNPFHLGDIRCEFRGAYSRDLQGDLGVMPCTDIRYRWGGKGHTDGVYLTQETYTLARPYGLVGWQTQPWDPQTKQYRAPTSVSAFNKIVAGSIQPQFPCF